MADKIKIEVTQSVVTPGGQTISEPQKIEVEAYDKIEVKLKADADGSHPVVVDVQPGEAGRVKFLMIRADKYSKEKKLSYSIGKDEELDKQIELDALQVFSTLGIIGLLPGTPKELYFYNRLGEEVAISILVGRDAALVKDSSSTSSAGSSTSITGTEPS